MEKLAFPGVGLSGKKSLLMILCLCLLLMVLLCPAGRSQVQSQSDKQQIVRQVAEKWIQVGIDYYNRGFFKAAEQSFLRAQDYQDYLTEEQREQLASYLEKTHVAAIERKRLAEHLQTAEELIEKGEFARAKTHLQKAAESEFLSEDEKNLVAEKLLTMEDQLGDQKNKIADLYNRSLDMFEKGQLEDARKGFIEVSQSGLSDAPQGQTADDYLQKIDELLSGQAAAQTPAVQSMPVPATPAQQPVEAIEQTPEQVLTVVQPQQPQTPVAAVAATESQAEESGYIAVINRKRNIVRSHTKAVVCDAVGKAERYITQDQFDKAKEALEAARLTVEQNRMQLGDELYKQYTFQLQELNDTLAARQTAKAKELEEQRQLDAAQAQQQYRRQMDAERSRRIAELMQSAVALQKQQRYEEALGQLESILVLDPRHDQALILKQTLEDTTNFRRQLELQKESSKESTDILVKTDEAAIPYADELRYPKNWREIAAKRKPEDVIGEDAATAEVYKQFDQIVDLSSLTPTMTFAEAVEVIKNSVDPPLKIVVLWRDLLDNAEIDQTTPINMDPISGVPLAKALQLLLKSVSGGLAELGYVVEDGVITIATVTSLPGKLETLVYDVTDLLGRPAEFFITATGGQGGAGANAQEIGGQGFQDEDQQQMDSQEMRTDAEERGQALTTLVQDTIEPDSWYDAGGEGTVTIYQSKKLIVRQTQEVHNRIKKLLVELRKALGHQVAIEARFLLVSENFLESIGVDISPITINLGDHWDPINIVQDSAGLTRPPATPLPDSFGGVDPLTGQPLTLASAISGGYGGILDDLQVSFLITATQAHRDSKVVTAPKVSVLSGESATLRVQRQIYWARDIEVETRESGDIARATFSVNYETGVIVSGSILNVTPTITPDRKHVLLNIVAQLDDFLGFRRQDVTIPVAGGVPGAGETMPIELPQTEVSRVQTRVSVPDGGTLLLGGQKLMAEVDTDAGVPVLSKIPLIGRAFSNRSKVKDTRVLLILVKPMIILQEETEAEAIAAMNNM